jgi:hypothetical protein
VGAIQDLLQEVPLSAVLKERVALAEQKLEHAMSENADLIQRIRALEKENAALRGLIPTEEAGGLDRDTALDDRFLETDQGTDDWLADSSFAIV